MHEGRKEGRKVKEGRSRTVQDGRFRKEGQEGKGKKEGRKEGKEGRKGMKEGRNDMIEMTF